MNTFVEQVDKSKSQKHSHLYLPRSRKFEKSKKPDIFSKTDHFTSAQAVERLKIKKNQFI